jgi:D-3-phosphoglycerate dehydrogenase / 2-oxoglutarate reductase
VRVHILDDWSDTLRGLPAFERLGGHEVTVWTDAAAGEVLAKRLAEAEALVLFRERTAISADLLARLPKLRMISGRGAYPHVDVAACSAQGVLFCSNKPADLPNDAAAELTWALVLVASGRRGSGAASRGAASGFTVMVRSRGWLRAMPVPLACG